MIPFDSVTPSDDSPDPTFKARSTRKPRTPGGQASRKSGGGDSRKSEGQTPKNADPGLFKLSSYIPRELNKKLGGAAAERECDKSDIVTQALEKFLSGIVLYDRSRNKPACDNVEDRQDGAAA